MKACRQVIGEPFDDECVAAQRQMRAMLFAGADRNQQS